MREERNRMGFGSSSLCVMAADGAMRGMQLALARAVCRAVENYPRYEAMSI